MIERGKYSFLFEKEEFCSLNLTNLNLENNLLTQYKNKKSVWTFGKDVNLIVHYLKILCLIQSATKISPLQGLGHSLYCITFVKAICLSLENYRGTLNLARQEYFEAAPSLSAESSTTMLNQTCMCKRISHLGFK